MSNDWNHGYYADEGYEYGYHPETSPAHIHWACTLQGIKAPSRNFTYLDLGCGQGLSLILHAVVHPESNFIGVDFMPTHIAHARELTSRLGLSNVTFIEGDFLDLAKNPAGIGEVDYVVAHGISAWVSKSVREGMWQLVTKVLKPGGIVYNSYNTYPFWYAATPFQHLVMQYNQKVPGVKAIELAIQKMQTMLAADSPMFNMLPTLEHQLNNMHKHNPAYLVQEYNNQTWEPKYVAHMLDEVHQYKLDYAGTANTVQVMKASYPETAYEQIQAESNLKLRETIRDFLICQSFRRDLYGKGHQTFWKAEKMRALGEQQFASLRSYPLPEDKPFTVSHDTLKVSLPRELFQEVLDAFGRQGNTVQAVQAKLPKHTLIEIAEMATYLHNGGWLGIVTNKPTQQAAKINQLLANSHLAGAPYNYLVLANTQRAVGLNNANMMLYALHANGVGKEELPKALQESMLKLNRRFCVEGREIEDESEFLKQAELHTQSFLESTLPQILISNP